MAGKTSLATDAASCYPTLTNKMILNDGDLIDELLLISSFKNETCHSMAFIWEEISGETLNDKVPSRVFRCIEVGQSLNTLNLCQLILD